MARELRAIWNLHCDLDVSCAAMGLGKLGDGLAHDLPGRRVDGGLAHGDGKPGLGDKPHTSARPENHAGTGRQQADMAQDQGAMGHIGIITGIFDNAGGCQIG